MEGGSPVIERFDKDPLGFNRILQVSQKASCACGVLQGVSYGFLALCAAPCSHSKIKSILLSRFTAQRGIKFSETGINCQRCQCRYLSCCKDFTADIDKFSRARRGFSRPHPLDQAVRPCGGSWQLRSQLEPHDSIKQGSVSRVVIEGTDMGIWSGM